MSKAVIRSRGIRGYVDTSGLSSKNHTLERWHRMAVNEIKVKAIENAPVNKDPGKAKRQGTPIGHLKKSITMRTVDSPSTNTHVGSVTANARYAIFVHEGTSTPILPRNGRYLRVPAGVVGAGRQEFILSGGMGSANPLRRLSNRVHFLSGPKAKHPGDILVRQVRGQKAQPFLRDALDSVSARRRWKSSRTGGAVLGL